MQSTHINCKNNDTNNKNKVKQFCAGLPAWGKEQKPKEGLSGGPVNISAAGNSSVSPTSPKVFSAIEEPLSP